MAKDHWLADLPEYSIPKIPTTFPSLNKYTPPQATVRIILLERERKSNEWCARERIQSGRGDWEGQVRRRIEVPLRRHRTVLRSEVHRQAAHPRRRRR